MYIIPEAKERLKQLAKQEKRNPSQQLLVIMDFYEKHNKS